MWAALAAAGVLLVLACVVTARPVATEIPSLDGYFARWAELHGGYDPAPTRWLRGWLRGTYAVCRPLARRGVQPDALTFVGAWGVALAAVLAGSVPLAAGLVLAVAAPLDNVDGCVAILSGRVTRFGYVLDSCVDRVCDGLALLGLWAAGAPVWSCVAAGSALGMLEYLRARAAAAGMDRIGVLSLGERPNRVIACCLGLIAAACTSAHRDLLAGLGADAVLGLSVVGLLQVGWAVRAELGRPDQPGDDLR